jgi:hypothetical protein
MVPWNRWQGVAKPEGRVHYSHHTWAEQPSGADGPQRRLCPHACLCTCGPPLTGGVRPHERTT